VSKSGERVSTRTEGDRQELQDIIRYICLFGTILVPVDMKTDKYIIRCSCSYSGVKLKDPIRLEEVEYLAGAARTSQLGCD
jgi:hypothetical protein